MKSILETNPATLNRENNLFKDRRATDVDGRSERIAVISM